MTSVTERLAETTARLDAQVTTFIVILQKLEETVNGTGKTGGLKERIAIAEEEIKRNKESFEKIGSNITALRNEMLIEIGKIAATTNANAKQKGDFWRDIWQGMIKAGAASLAVAVVGIAFWQFVIWLAANAPIAP
jgi:hypothetical protein